MRRTLFTADHEAYRETVREFIAREITPHYDSWEEARLVDRSAWLAAGKMGIVGLAVPEQYGGSGELDYRYRYVVAEEIARTGRMTSSFRTSPTSAQTSRKHVGYLVWLPVNSSAPSR
jgi:alkylation response protein AidB-like acyl-CoA dehydrogenase